MGQDQVINNFLSYLNLQKRFSPLTAESYSVDLHQFFAFLQRQEDELELGDITHGHIRAFIAGLKDQGMAASTVNHKLSTLRSFFKYLLRTGVLDKNPAQKVVNLKMPKRLPAFVDQSNMEQVFSAVEFGSDFEGVRDKLIIDLLYQTGMRRAELLALGEADVDLHSLQMRVTGKGNKQRLIPFGVELKRNLEAYLAVKKEQGLNHPQLLVTSKNTALKPHTLTTLVKQVLGGVTTAKKKSPHVLRHTFATHILDNGADINAVKELLGHASLAATQVYTHNTIDKLKKMYNQAHPRSGN